MAKRKEDREVIFRRIGGRIVPIAVGANLVRIGAGELRTVSGNIRSVSRPKFFSRSRVITARIGRRKVASAQVRTKKLFGKKVTFVEMFQGAGRAMKAAIRNESVRARTTRVAGFPVSKDSIKFTARSGGSLLTFGIKGKRLVVKKVSERGAQVAMRRSIKGTSSRVLISSFKRKGGKAGKIARGNKVLLAAGIASIGFGLFNREKN